MGIFRVIGKEVTKAVDYVVDKNRKAAMINRLRIVIKNERENTARAYVALGKYYMEHLRNPDDTQAEHLCQAVEESEARMKKAFNKLDEITSPVEEEEQCAGCNDDCDACPYYEELDPFQRQELAHSADHADGADDDIPGAPFVNEAHDAAAAEEERQEAEIHADAEAASHINPEVTAGKPDIFGEAAEDDAEQ